MDTNNNLNVTNTYDPSFGYCMNRLPCGYCRVLEKPCPMVQGTINPYPYDGPTVTYTTNTTDKNE